ncbi:Uncharacterized conserved protein (some members contain a von Willebrand factor type A (vWA) domain) [Alteromonadaceae bacterium Bs31]|nr:Uncharacterized conserved protein (some members contain a von Willebrand factor type A (vWA) domain) [Alteromonadaceae bacterium Bs31]
MFPTNTFFNREAEAKAGVHVSVQHLLDLRYLAKDATLENTKRSSAIAEGDSKTNFRGRGMEFAEVRPYQPGDDVRNIDWRVTARTTQTYTKLFQEERERPVFIVVDQRCSMFFGSKHVFKSYAAAELASLIAWIALKNNDRIGTLIFNDVEQSDLRAKRGKHALLAFINKLQLFNSALSSPNPAGESCHLNQIFTDIRRVAKPGSTIYFLSDFHDFDASCEESLSMLSRHTDVSLLSFFDPLEKSLPRNRELTISDSQNRLTIGAGSKDFSKKFTEDFANLQQGISRSCMNAGARLVNIDCSTDVSEHAKSLFLSPKLRGRR